MTGTWPIPMVCLCKGFAIASSHLPCTCTTPAVEHSTSESQQEKVPQTHPAQQTGFFSVLKDAWNKLEIQAEPPPFVPAFNMPNTSSVFFSTATLASAMHSTSPQPLPLHGQPMPRSDMPSSSAIAAPHAAKQSPAGPGVGAHRVGQPAGVEYDNSFASVSHNRPSNVAGSERAGGEGVAGEVPSGCVSEHAGTQGSSHPDALVASAAQGHMQAPPVAGPSALPVHGGELKPLDTPPHTPLVSGYAGNPRSQQQQPTAEQTPGQRPSESGAASSTANTWLAKLAAWKDKFAAPQPALGTASQVPLPAGHGQGGSTRVCEPSGGSDGGATAATAILSAPGYTTASAGSGGGGGGGASSGTRSGWSGMFRPSSTRDVAGLGGSESGGAYAGAAFSERALDAALLAAPDGIQPEQHHYR